MKSFLEFSRPVLNIPDWVEGPLGILAWAIEKMPDDEFRKMVERLDQRDERTLSRRCVAETVDTGTSR